MGKGDGKAEGARSGGHVRRGLTLLAAVVWLMRLPCSSSAQAMTLGIIEFYGLGKVSESSVREALQLKEGDPVPPDRAAVDSIEKRLKALPGVQDAALNAVCCVAGKTVLFVGIEEKGTRPLRFRASPKGKVRLPKPVVQAGEEFDTALQAAVIAGDAGEDDSQGYALMNNAAARTVQQRFLIFASLDASPYQDVLLHSSDETHRALAAMILGYADPKDQSIINDLVTGMSDPDANVRNNAMRALAVRATSEKSQTESRVTIPYQPFIRLLSSLDWTDRNKSLFALLQISEKHDPAFFKSLRKEALPALKEMSHWNRSEYGLPAFIILGRMNGFSEPAIRTAWQNDDYTKVLGGG